MKKKSAKFSSHKRFSFELFKLFLKKKILQKKKYLKTLIKNLDKKTQEKHSSL